MPNYVLGLMFEYERYHTDARIRIFADECLVDEFTLENHITSKKVQICKTETAGVKFNRTHSLYLPEKLLLYHISPKFLNRDIRIEIENDNNNHTNGWLTKYSYIKFHQIFLIPDALLQEKNWKMLAKRFCDKELTLLDKEMGDKKYWPDLQVPTTDLLTPADYQDMIINHKTITWTKGIYHYTIGGSFSLTIPICKKHKLKHFGRKFTKGKLELCLYLAELLKAYKSLNIST